MSSVSVYAYRDYHKFLAEWFKSKKQRPSMRSFAQRAGCSVAMVSMVVADKQRLQERWCDPFADVLRLDNEERAFFKMLVEHERAPTDALRRMIERRIEEIARFRSSTVVSEGTARLYRHWYYGAIADLAECEGFVADPAWIAARLSPPIQEAQAAEALEVLLELGRIKIVGDRVVGSEAPWVTPHQLTPSVLDEAVRAMHVDVARLAARSLTAFSASERQAQSLSLAVPRSALPELQRVMQEAVEQVIALASRQTEGPEMVVQVASYLFPVASVSAPSAPGGAVDGG
jgi:uncharacterized protein (TIGR02147 family)